MIQLKEIQNESDWRLCDLMDTPPFQQEYWYGEMQKNRGREVYRFAFEKEGKVVAYAQFVAYPLLRNLFYIYSAYGPLVSNLDALEMEGIKDSLFEFCKSRSIAFARLDFSPALSSEGLEIAKKVFSSPSKATSSGSYFQPRYEWFVGIEGSDEQILASMHQKTRYSVRLAEKRGVKIRIIDQGEIINHLDAFLKLSKDTAKRNSFELHDDEYYRCFFHEIGKRGNGFLVEAYLEEGKEEYLLASHLIVISGLEIKVAHYVFGGSSDEKKDLCAPYMAHFSAMKEAKKVGAVFYNMGGISENGEVSGWNALTTFKKKFGGHTVYHSPYMDVVVKKLWYYLYAGRKFIKHIFKRS